LRPAQALAVFLLLLSPVLAAESKTEATVRKLRPHFMLGVTAGPGDRWVEETKAQGARFDVRYQYLAGGVNTNGNWKNWNRPAGAFVTTYLNECGKMGVIPCLTWYQMFQSLPCGAHEAEDAGNKHNCDTTDTMKAYFEDVALLMKKCGEFGKPVIVHVEPDLWGYMRLSRPFAPNDPEKIHVVVKSTGLPELAELDDTAASFGKAFCLLRDKYAPNAVLAWHASKWGNPDPKAMANFCLKSGDWDVIFTDPSDRDSAWKVAHNYQAQGAWWSEKDFTSFRDWSGQLHQLTGLPLIAWQIPMGNTYLASCNNTEGHFMDNRPEYFLENYPENKALAEWKERGYIGLLFGGGAGGCTSVADVLKDGITNPEPIKGNKGEKATFSDDDGGYLRLRGANYYQKGPVPLLAEAAATAAAAPKKPPAIAAPPPPPVETAKADEKLVAEWQAKLVQRVNAAAKDGKPISAFVRIGDKPEKHALLGADEKELKVDINGAAMPLRWAWFKPADRVALVKSFVKDDDAESLMMLTVFLLADGQAANADDCLAKAALLDASGAQALRAAIKPAPPPPKETPKDAPEKAAP